MRAAVETRFLVVVIVVSLALSGLTIWSVHRQGRALQQRELADLRNAATAAAARREAAIRADLQRACDAAGHVWRVGGVDAMDTWAAEQREWPLTALWLNEDVALYLPQPPLTQPLPDPRDANDAAVAAQEEEEPGGALDYLKRLTGSSDPLTRAAALLSSAAYEQQLGHPLGAARIFADAAEVLRSTPGLARYAFRAEIERVDALLAAHEFDRAHDTFVLFLNGILTDHPGRLSERELERLREQFTVLGLEGEPALDQVMRELAKRVRQREALVATLDETLASPDLGSAAPIDHLAFINAETPAGEPILIALRRISDDARLALASPLRPLIERYWEPADEGATWQVARRQVTEEQTVLVRLTAAFGHSVLVPSPPVAARLQHAANRRLGILLATAVGTAGAWTLVIWMMIRLIARQRELARMQSRFVADVSHELKTPLALIRLLSETLAEGRVRDPERARDYHQTITRESERLGALLDNILDMGRIQSGRKQYEFAPCDVAAVARQAWSLFEQQFAQDGFTARLELADDLPTIEADPQAIEQVLVNLLQNAYRYGGEGKYVRLAVQREGHLAVISVEDRGIGMSRQQLQQLGQSFFRAEDSRVRQQRGAGLGLAIVHHIVNAHRGRIDVQSRPDHGTRFTIWLPGDRAKAPPAE